MGSFGVFTTLAHIPWQSVLHLKKKITFLFWRERLEARKLPVPTSSKFSLDDDEMKETTGKLKPVTFNLPEPKISYLGPGFEIWLLTFNTMLPLAVQMNR